MHTLDWIVVAAYLVWIVYDGLKRTKGTSEVEGYFLANRSLPWWAVGLSVMATQLSAITLVGATGQGYADGMRFVQFYFGLPIAMVILSVTLVPFFYRARVFTAYEYLERRFDLKTRTLASLLFLMSRGLSCGAIIAAPAVILSILLGWNLTLTIMAIGLPTVLYTMVGGVQAVTWTDVKQMAVIVSGVIAAVVFLILGLPDHVGVGQALRLAGTAGRLNPIDFTFDWRQTYTFWSGMLGGVFLMLSYFGCDQSQVQRYLTAKSVDEGRAFAAHERLRQDSAAGPGPADRRARLRVLSVQPAADAVPAGRRGEDREERARRRADTALQSEFGTAFESRRSAATTLAEAGAGDLPGAAAAFLAADDRVTAVRGRAAALARQVGESGYKDFTGDTPTPDVNYVFPTFVTTRLPMGLVG